MPTAPNTEYYSQMNQISDANADGQMLGQSATDRVAFYGKIPQAQKAAAMQSSFTSGASSTASFFGAVSVNATSWTAMKCASSALTASTQWNVVLAEVVDTLLGLGLWKGSA
jgi:hypothetical protein